MDTADKTLKTCHSCGEDISADARRCPFCGYAGEPVKPEQDGSRSDSAPVSETAGTYRQPAGDTDERGLNNIASVNTGSTVETVGQIGVESSSLENEAVVEMGAQNQTPDAKAFSPANQAPVQNVQAAPERKKSISNGMKVLLTTICTIIPGLGQIAGVIMGIIFMNTENDPDKKAFGSALLITSLVIFVISCMFYFVFALALSAAFYSN